MHKERILFVDDEPNILETCKACMEREQFEVLTADSGDMALDILKNSDTDILVTDINMPGMKGTDLLKKVNAIRPGMPTAIITGYGTMDLAMECMMSGAGAFILKPFTTGELKSTVRQLIERDLLLRENLKLKTILPLLEVSRQLIEKVEVNDIFRFIVSEAMSGIKGSCASLMMLENNRIKIVEMIASSKRFTETIKRISSLAGKIMAGKKNVIFRDGGKSWASLHGCKDNAGLAFSIAVPIVIDGRGVGLLNVGRAEGYEEFSEVDIDYLEILSNHLASSMERSTLYGGLAKALEDAREAGRIKDAFLNNISHEFRTPLNAILGFSDILLEEAFNGPAEFGQRKELRIIHDRSEDLLKLFENIMDVTFLEGGTIKVSKETVGLFSLLSELVGAYEDRARKKGLDLNIDLKEKEINIITDPYLLRKALANIMENAVKFTGEGRIIISLAMEGSDAVIRVSDSGIGITKEKMDIVFEKFRQGDDSNTRIYGGAGVGLYLARGIADILGGTLRVNSPWLNELTGIYETGSRFVLKLPLK